MLQIIDYKHIIGQTFFTSPGGFSLFIVDFLFIVIIFSQKLPLVLFFFGIWYVDKKNASRKYGKRSCFGLALDYLYFRIDTLKSKSSSRE